MFLILLKWYNMTQSSKYSNVPDREMLIICLKLYDASLKKEKEGGWGGGWEGEKYNKILKICRSTQI